MVSLVNVVGMVSPVSLVCLFNIARVQYCPDITNFNSRNGPGQCHFHVHVIVFVVVYVVVVCVVIVVLCCLCCCCLCCIHCLCCLRCLRCLRYCVTECLELLLSEIWSWHWLLTKGECRAARADKKVNNDNCYIDKICQAYSYWCPFKKFPKVLYLQQVQIVNHVCPSLNDLWSKTDALSTFLLCCLFISPNTVRRSYLFGNGYFWTKVASGVAQPCRISKWFLLGKA